VKRLTPYEVEEYGIKDGDIYQSFEIQIDTKTERFFFQRLLKGRISLYSIDVADGTKKYFITADDSTKLIALPDEQKDRKAILKERFNDSPDAVNNLNYLHNNENNLILLLRNYNNGTKRPLPRIHFGIRLGADGTQLSAREESGIYFNGKYKKDWNMAIGASLDIPLFNSFYSLSPEIYYKSLHTKESFDVLKNSYDLQLDYSSINIPLFIRYSFLKKNFSPYVQAGPLISKMMTNTAVLYTFKEVGDDINSDRTKAPIMSKSMGGYSVGCGFISNYGGKTGWFGEARYSKLYNNNISTKNLNIGDLSFMIGVIF